MPKIVDKQQKARRIARAAMRAFRTQGFHRCTMADIARAASVGKGTLYEYFKDKTDILHFAFEDYFETFKAGALKAMAGSTDAAEQLGALLEFALDYLGQWEDHCAVYVDYLAVAHQGGAGGGFSLERFYDEFRSILKRLLALGQQTGRLRGDLDPQSVAELLLAWFDGVVLHRIFDGRTHPEQPMRQAAVRIISGGLFTANGP